MKRLAKHVVRLVAYFCFRSKKLDTNKMRKIWSRAKVCCVVCASGIGDSIMATPLIEMIKQRKVGVRLIVVGTETTAQVFKGNPNVDLVMEYSLKHQGLIPFALLLWRIRKEHIDVFFGAQPFGNISHSLIAACSRAHVVLKHASNYRKSWERDFSFAYTALLPDRIERHRIELNLDFLRFLGEDIQEKSVYPRYEVSKSAQEKTKRWLLSVGKNKHSDRLIAIHPGGTRQNKRWMPGRFAEVCKDLVKRDFTVCLVGGRDEKSLCDDIAQKISLSGILNAAGTFSLEETAALLRRCRCLISNDTGIMHLATAVGRPVIAIFGPTDFRHIGPFSPAARIVFKSQNIEDVMPSDVIKAVLKEVNTKNQLE